MPKKNYQTEKIRSKFLFSHIQSQARKLFNTLKENCIKNIATERTLKQSLSNNW